MNGRLRLAYFSPFPPQHSGIADYSAELVTALGKLADLTLFADEPASTTLPFPIEPTEKYADLYQQFDLPLYHMGNSHFHARMYAMMARFPGVMVLHDYGLHHLMGTLAYRQELGYCLGRDRATTFLDGHTPHLTPYDLPLSQRAIDLNLGIIVHSRFAAGKIQAHSPQKSLATIPMLMPLRPSATKPLRAELGLPPDALLFGTIGQVVPNKQLPLCLSAFAQVAAALPKAHFVILGEAVGVEVSAEIAQLPPAIQKRVHNLGYIPSLQRFRDWTAAIDAILILRHPTAGETSAAAIRALAEGKPLIVFDHGWYAELPDDSVLKLPPMDKAALVAAMHSLAQAEKRQAMHHAARHYIEKRHNPDKIAIQYVNFINKLLADIQKKYENNPD